MRNVATARVPRASAPLNPSHHHHHHHHLFSSFFRKPFIYRSSSRFPPRLVITNSLSPANSRPESSIELPSIPQDSIPLQMWRAYSATPSINIPIQLPRGGSKPRPRDGSFDFRREEGVVVVVVVSAAGGGRGSAGFEGRSLEGWLLEAAHRWKKSGTNSTKHRSRVMEL